MGKTAGLPECPITAAHSYPDFTVNLLERHNTYLSIIDALRDALERTRRSYLFTIDAVVVLPDHIHAIWTLPPNHTDFSLRWRLIKSRFVQALPKQEHLSDERKARGERGIWQRRFWHLIRDEADYARHVDYCYINSVKHGLLAKVSDWPHSSFHRDVGAEIFPEDWAGDADSTREFGER